VRAERVQCLINLTGVSEIFSAVGISLALIIPAEAITLALRVSEAQANAEVVARLINLAFVRLVFTVGISIADIVIAVSITLALCT